MDGRSSVTNNVDTTVSLGEYKNVLQEKEIRLQASQENDIQKEILPQKVVIVSWFSSGVGDLLSGELNTYASGARQWGFNNVASFIQNEADKGQLRGAELEGILSGVPVVGDVLRGLNGVQEMEDLYNSTGKVVAYPSGSNLGTSGLGHVGETVANRIADGTHDLHKFYSGDTSDIWEQMSRKSNWNSKYHKVKVL